MAGLFSSLELSRRNIPAFRPEVLKLMMEYLNIPPLKICKGLIWAQIFKSDKIPYLTPTTTLSTTGRRVLSSPRASRVTECSLRCRLFDLMDVNSFHLQGEYSVRLPNGLLQTVSYTVLGEGGFSVNVRYSGEQEVEGELIIRMLQGEAERKYHHLLLLGRIQITTTPLTMSRTNLSRIVSCLESNF